MRLLVSTRAISHPSTRLKFTLAVRVFFGAMAKNGSSASVLGQKRVGRGPKAASIQFGLT